MLNLEGGTCDHGMLNLEGGTGDHGMLNLVLANHGTLNEEGKGHFLAVLEPGQRNRCENTAIRDA